MIDDDFIAVDNDSERLELDDDSQPTSSIKDQYLSEPS